jgi:hypothetical protein
MRLNQNWRPEGRQFQEFSVAGAALSAQAHDRR